jgi:hypothetical protein
VVQAHALVPNALRTDAKDPANLPERRQAWLSQTHTVGSVSKALENMLPAGDDEIRARARRAQKRAANL